MEHALTAIFKPCPINARGIPKMQPVRQTDKPSRLNQLLLAALAAGFAMPAIAQDKVDLGGPQEIVVEDSTAQVSNDVGAVQVFANGNVPGAAVVSVFNNGGVASGNPVYSLGKLGGWWDAMGRNVGVQGHVPGTGSGGWGVLGSSGGWVDINNTGINSPEAWGALGAYVSDGADWAVYANGPQFSTTGTLWVASDERLKTNIQDVRGALDIIRDLRPSRFEYLQEFRDQGLALPEADQYGFLAQHLEAVVPSLVRDVQLPLNAPAVDREQMQESGQEVDQDQPPPTYKAIQILGLIPLLTSALQELNDKVDVRVAQVAEENAQLKERLAALEARTENLALLVSSSAPAGPPQLASATSE
jgi:hypothetical protein